jgi:hypothetical protein
LRSTLHYAGTPEKFQRGPGPYVTGSSGTAASISFEFRDANGRLIRGQSLNQGHVPAAGAYVPVFYDAQNSENCAPACTLNYDLAVPRASLVAEASPLALP